MTTPNPRAEAQRRYPLAGRIVTGPLDEQRAFVAGAEWLASTAQPAPTDDATEGLIQYVLSVVRDRKYGNDPEWVRMNLHPQHLRHVADEFRELSRRVPTAPTEGND